MGRARWVVAAAVLLAAAPAVQAARFTMSVSPVTAAELHWSYRPGCPVPPSDLRLLRLTDWGFDGRSHEGAIVVNRAVVAAVGRVFATLYAGRFPIRRNGEAIDVNPLENPYELAGGVYPPAGRAYLDRADIRPGMAVTGGRLVAAFASVGWQWGGRWTGSPDYQHFSATGG
jgi:hypothetical protein